MGLSTIISQNYHSKLGQHKETKYMVLLNNLKEWMVLKNGSFLNQLDVSLNVYFAWTYSENFENPKWSDEISETALEIKHLQNVLKLVYEYYELHNLDAKIFICLLWRSITHSRFSSCTYHPPHSNTSYTSNLHEAWEIKHTFKGCASSFFFICYKLSNRLRHSTTNFILI